MKLHAFTPPLSRIATHFIEEWSFEAQDDGTLVTRAVQMYPTGSLTRPLLWFILRFMRRAIEQHLAKIAA